MTINRMGVVLGFALLVCILARPAYAFNWFGEGQNKEVTKKVAAAQPPALAEEAKPQAVQAEAAPGAAVEEAEAEVVPAQPASDPNVVTEEPMPAPPSAEPVKSMPGLEERIANNKSMTDEQKTELVDAMKKAFPDKTDFKDARREKEVLFFEQTANDPNMKQEEKIAAIQKHFTELPPQQFTAVKEEKPVEVPADPQPAEKETEKT